MERGTAASRDGGYPEKADADASFFDRLAGDIGFRWHGLLGRPARHGDALARETRKHLLRFADGLPAARVPDLRYRLRRDGLRGALVPEVLALYAAAANIAPADLDPEILCAADTMIRRRIAELADPVRRREATAFACAAFALAAIPVHLVCATEMLALRSAESMQGAMAALGISVACIRTGMDAPARRAAYQADIACVTTRELAQDYLSDRLVLGGRPRGMHSALQRLAGEGGNQARLMLRGLQCAVVDDADMVLIDDAGLPMAISVEADQSRDRLLYEQAMEFARALSRDDDYVLEGEGVALTGTGSGRLARLVQTLGGIWNGQQRRELLVSEALVALHCLRRDAHYKVTNDRVIFPPPQDPQAAEQVPDPMRQRLVEVKEGLRFAGSRDVLGRISVPKFFVRYLHLCGAAADASGIEPELWSIYHLKCDRAAGVEPMPRGNHRVFAMEQQKIKALVQALPEAAGLPLVIACRNQAVGKAILDALSAAGAQPGILLTGADPREAAALASLRAPGAVTLAVAPAERNVVPAPGPAPRLIVAEAHDSWRQLRRLQQAYGAQGCEVWLSLEEETVVAELGLGGAMVAATVEGAEGEAAPGRARWLVERVQRGIEFRQAGGRQELLAFDRYVNDILAVTGSRD